MELTSDNYYKHTGGMKYGWPRDMTMQEAHEFAAFALRLKRVWNVDDGTLHLEAHALKYGVECHFKVEGHEVTIDMNDTYTSIYMYRGIIRQGPPILMCQTKEDRVFIVSGETYKGDKRYIAQQELDRQFSAAWMPFFRRACWLSGVDIEASAHEKAEWIRGLTREEIEAWNLTI